MGFWNLVANLIFAGIDLIAYEMILSIIFRVDNNGVKFFFDWLFGLSKYISTIIYILVSICLGIIYYFGSNYFQEDIIQLFVNMKWKVLPLFVGVYSLAAFWLAKINLGRKLSLPVVWISLLTFIMSTFISILLLFV